jgi:hypothetical protein
MDDKKTIEVTQPVSLRSSDLPRLTVFGGNEHFAFIYKKTEKLVSAIYMITNFIKDNEPLKWRIREEALDLMSLNLSLNTVSLSERTSKLKEYQAHSIEIVSLSTIAFHAGLVSEMNHTVLKREFENLLDIIESDQNKKNREETVTLASDFFHTDIPVQKVLSDISPRQSVAMRTEIPTTAPVTSRVEIAPVSIMKPVVEIQKQESVSTPVFYAQAERTHVASIVRDTTKLPINNTDQGKRSYGAVEEKKSGRQDIITNLLKKRQGLNIKDFSHVISGCSEKTIQRELLEMVARGTLRKEGDRRWSKYFLLQA